MKELCLSILLLLFCFTIKGQVDNNLSSIITDFQALEVENKNKWPNTDSKAKDLKTASYRTLLDRLTSIDSNALDEQGLINKQVLQLIMKEYISSSEFGIEQMPLNAEGGFLAGVVHMIRSQKPQADTSFINYIKLIAELPDYFDKRIELMKQGMVVKKQSPKLIVENCIKLLTIWMQRSYENSIYHKPYFSDNQNKQVEVIYDNRIIPAYKKMQKFLKEEYLPKAPSQVGISFIENGAEYYRSRTAYYSTYAIEPKEVFDIGMNEVERIREEMKQIISNIGFDGSFEAFFEFLRTDEQFYPDTPDELLAKAAFISKEIEGELPKYFGKLTSLPFAVKPVPEAIAENYTTGRYSGGSWKDKRSGEYWVNTTKLDSRTLYTLPALTLHEAVPGHHLQTMLAKELDNLPKFRNTYISAFGEGWALYGEYLGKEMGIYKTAYEDFGRLTYEMWRACRLVVDPGMHYLGWSREKAVEFMKANTALSLHEIDTEINRYIGWPGQAISYKLGELKIKALREKVENELGNKFDLRSFHDKILENGSVPLAALETIIVNYIEDSKTKSSSINKGLVHTVFIWLNDEVNTEEFETGINDLKRISTIEKLYWGKSADTKKRKTVDDSYDYAINIFFKSLADHDAYQENAIHKNFINNNKDNFLKVVIYDNEINN